MIVKHVVIKFKTQLMIQNVLMLLLVLKQQNT